jgi:predicted RNA-binding protein with PIN domain
MHVIVDVLNVLHAVDPYRGLLKKNFDLALDRLMQDLVNYRDWSADHVTLVIRYRDSAAGLCFGSDFYPAFSIR